MNPLLQFLTYALPIIGTTLPGLLKQDGLPAHINAYIALVALVLLAALHVAITVWGQVGMSPIMDFLLVLSTVSIMIAGPLKPLDTYLVENTSFIKQEAPVHV